MECCFEARAHSGNIASLGPAPPRPRWLLVRRPPPNGGDSTLRVRLLARVGHIALGVSARGRFLEKPSYAFES